MKRTTWYLVQNNDNRHENWITEKAFENKPDAITYYQKRRGGVDFSHYRIIRKDISTEEWELEPKEQILT